MSDINFRDIHSHPVTLWQIRAGEDDWWQFYDDGSDYHQVCRIDRTSMDSHEIWVPDGWVEMTLPDSRNKVTNNDEKIDAYKRYIIGVYENEGA